MATSIINSYKELRCHGHELILSEDYNSHEGKLCFGCGLILNSSSAVYRCIYFSSPEKDDCAHFFLHKSCAHLPHCIKHPSHQHVMDRRSWQGIQYKCCSICGNKLAGLSYICYPCDTYYICVKCVVPIENININPAYHCHKLTLSTRLATFQCDACHEVDTDFSYVCYTCPFYIHLACSNLPTFLECKSHHKHPLTLAYSLPKIYHKFQQSCRICSANLFRGHWLYYCPDCRFFAHIKCATSPKISRKRNNKAYDDYSSIVHIPPPEHEWFWQQYIKKEIIYWLKDAPVTPPVHINHWSHEQHQMVVKNRSGFLSITDDEGLFICNGCTRSISTSDDVFYECSECEYILHRYCALFPKEMQLYVEGKVVGIQPSVHDIWTCTRCEGFRNGTQMRTTYVYYNPWSSHEGDDQRKINVKLDIECAALPKLLKHEAHPHLLEQRAVNSECSCYACYKIIRLGDALLHCVGGVEHGYCMFKIHIKCALKPLRVTHRWDPHPLYLIFSAEEVVNHPHEFQCEFCSEEINTNCWFYHCSICDLSFHLEECIDLFPYSRVKFGATNIKIQDHQHSLTFVLNKKRRPCQKCHKDTYGRPVLECTPCKFTQHAQPHLCS